MPSQHDESSSPEQARKAVVYKELARLIEDYILEEGMLSDLRLDYPQLKQDTIDDAASELISAIHTFADVKVREGSERAREQE